MENNELTNEKKLKKIIAYQNKKFSKVDDISEKNIIKNHLPNIRATIEKIKEWIIMNKKIILNCLKNHLQEFKEKYNVEKIGLFGSYARDEATEESDIDIFVKMPPKMFDRIAIKNLLQEELGKEVDIIREHKNIDSLLMEMIQKDIIYVNNTTPIEKQNLFKEHYNKKLQDIQNLKDNFIKNNSLSLKYITDRTAFKIPYNGVICD